MKTNKLSHRALLSYICLPVLLVVSISSSAAVQVAAAINMQAIAVMNQQTAEAEQGEMKTEGSKPTEVKDQAAEDEKRKKYCATARKNLELLRSNTEGRAFTTEDGKIVKYTPDQLQKMIKESEAAEKANCD